MSTLLEPAPGFHRCTPDQATRVRVLLPSTESQNALLETIQSLRDRYSVVLEGNIVTIENSTSHRLAEMAWNLISLKGSIKAFGGDMIFETKNDVK